MSETPSKDQEKEKRLNLLLPGTAMERLEFLKTDTEASSYVEVIKNALKLYEFVVSETRNGNDVAIKNSSGEMTFLRLLV